jgi:type IV pilus assembly protein PilF
MKKALIYCSVIFILAFICVGCGSKRTEEITPRDQTGTVMEIDSNAAAEINAQLGIYYMKQGNLERAKEKLTLALNQSPKNAKVLSSMGYYLETIGEPVKAERYYLNAISIAPQDGTLKNNYGTFLCRSKRYYAAIDQFLTAVKDPNYIASAEAYENAGLCAMEIPNLKLAEDYFSKALQNNYSLEKSLFEMSQISYQEGDYAKADQYFQKLSQVAQLNQEALNLGIKINEKLKNKRGELYYRDRLKSYENAVTEQKENEMYE